MSHWLLPYPPSRDNRPRSFPRNELASASESTLEPEAAVSLNPRSHSPRLGSPCFDHLPHPPPRPVRNLAEEWIPLDTKADSKLRGCRDLDKSNLKAAVLYSQITNKLSHEPDAGFVQTVNDLLHRANNDFLKEIPRQALAKAYAARALTHGEDLETAIVDFLTSLQLFSSGNATQENTGERDARDLMLNMLMTLCVRKGLLDGPGGLSAASSAETANGREPNANDFEGLRGV